MDYLISIVVIAAIGYFAYTLKKKHDAKKGNSGSGAPGVSGPTRPGPDKKL